MAAENFSFGPNEIEAVGTYLNFGSPDRVLLFSPTILDPKLAQNYADAGICVTEVVLESGRNELAYVPLDPFNPYCVAVEAIHEAEILGEEEEGSTESAIFTIGAGTFELVWDQYLPGQTD